jgi:hypothetical protein
MSSADQLVIDQFLQENASALFGLAGIFAGALLSFFAAWLLRKRDYDLRLWDKLLERRIDAHERLINVALEMRVMVSLGGVGEAGEIVRAPRVLRSQEVFEAWFTRAIESVGTASTWLSIAAKREANLFQDYLVTLHIHLEHVPSDRYLTIGVIVRQDFIDISASLERVAFSFFGRDVRRLKLSNLNEWHKYPREHTEQRLKETQLLRRWNEVSQLAVRKDDDIS